MPLPPLHNHVIHMTEMNLNGDIRLTGYISMAKQGKEYLPYLLVNTIALASRMDAEGIALFKSSDLPFIALSSAEVDGTMIVFAVVRKEWKS